MAKFFICLDSSGATFDCVLSFALAKTIVAAAGGGTVVSADINLGGLPGRENVARILGNLGGYAKTTKTHAIRGTND